MKARVPKEWHELSKGAQNKLIDFCVEQLNLQENKDMRIVLELLIKMICCLLYDTEDFDETKLILFVGNFQMVFKEQQKLVSKGKQLEFFDKRLEKIFPENGFPQSFIDGLLGEIDKRSLENGALRKTMEEFI